MLRSKSETDEKDNQDYNIGLKAILAEPDLVMLFREFLKNTFSSENLAFIIEVENFKNLWSRGVEDEVIKKRAHEIFEKYFSETSSYELNISSGLLAGLQQRNHIIHSQELKEKMKSPTTSVFNKCEQSVFQLVESDSYPRFIRSIEYRTYIDGKFLLIC